MPNINEIFTKAIVHARSVMGDVVIALKKSNKEMFSSLENKNDLSTSKIVSELKAVDNSIKNKEITKEVAVTNLKEITDSAKEIVATLKSEISKLDKEVIVNTDISALTDFFKEKENKKEKEKNEKMNEDEILFKYLDKIQNTLENIDITFPEAIDNTNLLNKIATAIESKTNEKLEVLLQEIKDKENIFPAIMDVNLNPLLIENDRIRTVLPKEQVDLMSKVVTGGGIKNVFLENDNGRISQDNPLSVREWSKVSTLNSTMEKLDADEVFTGEWEEILQYSVLLVGVKSDVASATDGLSVQFSPDGANYVNSDEYTIPSNSGKTFSFQPCGRYFRVVYTNGGTDQTSFSIESILKSDYVKPSSHRIQDSIIEDDDAELVKSVITGLGENGVFSNAKVSSSGRLKVVSQPYTYAIAEGDVLGHRPLRRFGHNPSVGTSLETVSNDSALYTYLTSAEYLRIVSTSASDDIAGVGMRSIFIQGLDGDYNIVNEVVELDGTTPVYTTTHQYIRLLAAYGSAVGTTPGNVGIITISNNAGTNIIGTLPVGEGRWNSAIMTVPAGGTVYITDWYGSENSSKGSEISLWKREFGDGGWQLLRLYTLLDNEFENEIKTPLSFTEKTDIEVRAKSKLGGANVAAGFYGWIE